MPDKSLDRLAAAIRTARNQREMTQETLSDLSGVSVRHIGKIENGEINPSFEVLLSLVTTLKISFDTLFYQDSLPGTGPEGNDVSGTSHSKRI